MGALFGYVGSEDSRLMERMGTALAHRGSGSSTSHRWAGGALGYKAQYADLPEVKQAAGLCHDDTHTLGLVGYAVAADGSALSPELLLRRFKESGLEFLAKLHGAFVMFIRNGRDTYLIRDASGIRTAYYGQHDGRLLFGIEPKAVTVAPGFPRRIRSSSVAQYLTFSFIPGSNTMLEDVYEVPSGHYLHYRDGESPKLVRHYRFEHLEPAIDAPPKPDSYWIERYAELVQRSVSESMPRGEEIGVFLSGGVDSSVVVAEVAKQLDRPPRTYAMHFGDDYPHELDFAREVAERCKTNHTEVELRPKNFLPRLRQIIWHLDDPIGDPITVPNFELAQRARQDVRWVYNGEGGDPCFGGPKNLFMMMQHWYGGVDRGPGFRERTYLASYRRAYEERSRLLSPGLLGQVDEERDLEGVLTPFFNAAEPRSLLNKLMAINIRLKGAHLILPKVDRMMGAAGLTPFAPLFDDRIVSLSFQMPGTMKIRGGLEKWVAKRAYEDQLPRSVIDRPKSGMRVPVHYWFRGEMKRYARKILSPRSVRRAGIFNEKRVKQLLDYNTIEGPGRYGLRLWMLVTFEMWRRIVVEGESL